MGRHTSCTKTKNERERSKMRKSTSQQNQRHMLNQLETRFKTVMIGSLSRIEDHLGFLWGHDKKTLTEQQEKFLNIWEDLRNEILNHGNYHLREGLSDLEEFFAYQAKHNQNDTYSYKFYVNDNQRRS